MREKFPFILNVYNVDAVSASVTTVSKNIFQNTFRKSVTYSKHEFTISFSLHVGNSAEKISFIIILKMWRSNVLEMSTITLVTHMFSSRR